MSLIEIKNLTKSFGTHVVLDHLSLSLPLGETTCIMGPSGSGKTTLIHILAGLQPYGSGEILGVPSRIGFVFQEDRLSESYSVLANIRLVTGRSVPEETIRAHLDALGIGDTAALPVRKLSGGMKRRAAIARAVLFRPELLILDEPFKGLDAAMRQTAMDYIKAQLIGKTVLCVTHDPDEAAYLGGNLVRLEYRRRFLAE